MSAINITKNLEIKTQQKPKKCRHANAKYI